MRASPWMSCVLALGCAAVPATPPAVPETPAPFANAISDGLPDYAVTLRSAERVADRSPREPVAPLGPARAEEPVLPSPIARPPLAAALCGVARELRLRSRLDHEGGWSRAGLALSIQNPDPACRDVEAVLESVSCERTVTFAPRACGAPRLSSL